MQAHSNIIWVRIADLVQAQIITHICEHALPIQRLLDNLGLLVLGAGESVPRFLQRAFQDLHQAMCVCMIVNCATFSGGPD